MTLIDIVLASAEPPEADPPVPCPACSCPVQWQPLAGATWRCYDCQPPHHDSQVAAHRMPVLVGRDETGQDLWEWEVTEADY